MNPVKMPFLNDEILCGAYLTILNTGRRYYIDGPSGFWRLWELKGFELILEHKEVCFHLNGTDYCKWHKVCTFKINKEMFYELSKNTDRMG